MKISKDETLKQKYAEYRIDAVIEAVENLYDESEKHALLKNFDNHLANNKLLEIRSQIIKGNYSKSVKEELYHFVDKHWHHILDSLKSYSEFCKSEY